MRVKSSVRSTVKVYDTLCKNARSKQHFNLLINRICMMNQIFVLTVPDFFFLLDRNIVAETK